MSHTVQADPELEAMIAIARVASARAAELYRQHLAGGIAVEEKGPGDPVTAADRELDATIGAALRAQFPDAGVVSEESAPAAAELAALLVSDAVFYVDPIDGTRELVAKTGEFAVMIGLAVGGRASAGVVAIPDEELLVAGRVGAGAFSEGPDGARRLVTASAIDSFGAARMLVSRSHTPAIVEPLRRRLGIATVVPCGSVGVKVARIATGQAELYVHAGHGMARWDTCAAEAILVAAGGRMTDLDGQAVDYAAQGGLGRGIVATNGLLHAGVMSAVSWAEREARRIGG